MSEFHSGKYKDIEFETYPIINVFGYWLRKPKILRYFPYWTAKKVTFVVKIFSNNEKLLSDIPIFSKPSDSKFSQRIEIGEFCKIEDNGKKVTILTDGLRGSYILKYYFGNPETSNYKEIAELQANWKDKIWFVILGFLLSLIPVFLAWILGFIQIVPYYIIYGKP
jgi:hypothetical protein